MLIDQHLAGLAVDLRDPHDQEEVMHDLVRVTEPLLDSFIDRGGGLGHDPAVFTGPREPHAVKPWSTKLRSG